VPDFVGVICGRVCVCVWVTFAGGGHVVSGVGEIGPVRVVLGFVGGT
jgi:hypothetical protein